MHPSLFSHVKCCPKLDNLHNIIKLLFCFNQQMGATYRSILVTWIIAFLLWDELNAANVPARCSGKLICVKKKPVTTGIEKEGRPLKPKPPANEEVSGGGGAGGGGGGNPSGGGGGEGGNPPSGGGGGAGRKLRLLPTPELKQIRNRVNLRNGGLGGVTQWLTGSGLGLINGVQLSSSMPTSAVSRRQRLMMKRLKVRKNG